MYQTALQVYPEDAVLLNDVALCYARTEQSDRALAALQRAVELNPSSTLYRNNMAAVLVEANRSAEAVPLLAQTYGTAVAHYNVGYLLHQRGEDQAAVDHFSAALEVNPSLTPARSMLNRLAPQLGKRPMRSRSPDNSRQPSAALTPNSSLGDGSIDPSVDTLSASPAAWTVSDTENEAPNVVPSVGTRVFDAEVLPASHMAPSQEFEESSPESSDNTQARPDSLNLLSRPILNVQQHGPGHLVPPVPQSVKQPVQTRFLPTQLPQPE
jgi:tetratricopeptide (TPR) repeat protein